MFYLREFKFTINDDLMTIEISNITNRESKYFLTFKQQESQVLWTKSVMLQKQRVKYP